MPNKMDVPVAKPVKQSKPKKAKVARGERKRKAVFSVDGGKMLGGVLMMVGAAVWFGLGLMSGYIFWYPPVLFVLGAGAFINGLFGPDGTW